MTLIKKQLFRTILVLTTCLSAAPIALAEGQGQRLETKMNLSAGMHNIVAEVAKTPRERDIGLMFRKQMATHEGMIFVFDEPATQCFWMRNTYLPLSIAFVADDGTVVNIEDMQPQTETSHCSTKPVRFVLEMNQGWFAKRGIKAGFKLKGPLFR